MTLRQRLLFTGIYGLAAVLLWLVADYVTPRDLHEVPLAGAVGLGLPYLASIVCAVLSFLSLIGKLPRIPEDEPNI